jgi:hypothetical protein
MIRPITLLAAMAACASGYYVYAVSHQVDLLDRQIERTVHEASASRERIRMLHAEWTVLNRPERLQRLADQYLSLQPTKPQQFVSMADLASRLPPVAPTPVASSPDASPSATSPSPDSSGAAPDGGAAPSDAVAAQDAGTAVASRGTSQVPGSPTGAQRAVADLSQATLAGAARHPAEPAAGGAAAHGAGSGISLAERASGGGVGAQGQPSVAEAAGGRAPLHLTAAPVARPASRPPGPALAAAGRTAPEGVRPRPRLVAATLHPDGPLPHPWTPPHRTAVRLVPTGYRPPAQAYRPPPRPAVGGSLLGMAHAYASGPLAPPAPMPMPAPFPGAGDGVGGGG